MRNNIEFKNNIENLINDVGIKKSWLARNVGITREYLYRIMNGKAEPGGKLVFLISKALGKKVDEVFFINPVKSNLQKREGEDEGLSKVT